MDSGGLEDGLADALPNNEDILGTHNSVAMRPPPSLSQCCNVEGTRKSYHEPFPLRRSVVVEPMYTTPSQLLLVDGPRRG
jgi:hypothetical protein